MTQSRIDSLMESLTNTAIGFVVSLVTWIVVARLYGIPMSWSTNLSITAIFTVVSVARQYVLRRLFNGRTPWAALKRLFQQRVTTTPGCYGSRPSFQERAENDCFTCRLYWECVVTASEREAGVVFQD